MTAQHTPGPWRVNHKSRFILDDKGIVAEAIPYDGTIVRPDVEIEANARLIAESPNLLETLKWVAFHIEHRLKYRQDLFTAAERARLNNAITKAEGKERDTWGEN